MERDELLAILRAQKPYLARRFGVRRMALFGSYAKERANPKSDIDLLVELEGEQIFRNFFALRQYLEEQLHRPVDLGTFAALKKSVREQILQEAVDV